MNLNKMDFEKAMFEVTIKVSEEKGIQNRLNDIYFDSYGNKVIGLVWNDISFVCKTTIKTSDIQYNSEIEDNVQWPEGWLK